MFSVTFDVIFLKKIFWSTLIFLASVLTKLAEFQKSAKFPTKNTKYVNGRGGVMRYLTTILGEQTLQSILSTLRNTYGPNVSTYFRIESQKSWKMRCWAYFGTFLLTKWIFTYFKRILTLIKEDV